MKAALALYQDRTTDQILVDQSLVEENEPTPTTEALVDQPKITSTKRGLPLLVDHDQAD